MNKKIKLILIFLGIIITCTCGYLILKKDKKINLNQEMNVKAILK